MINSRLKGRHKEAERLKYTYWMEIRKKQNQTFEVSLQLSFEDILNQNSVINEYYKEFEYPSVYLKYLERHPNTNVNRMLYQVARENVFNTYTKIKLLNNEIEEKIQQKELVIEIRKMNKIFDKEDKDNEWVQKMKNKFEKIKQQQDEKIQQQEETNKMEKMKQNTQRMNKLIILRKVIQILERRTYFLVGILQLIIIVNRQQIQ